MIVDTLEGAERYRTLHPGFAAAFAFLRQPDLPDLAPGRHTIAGEEIFAIVARSPARPRAEAKLECHRRYIDIQFIIAGRDAMGWKPAAACREPMAPYDPDKDIEFFADPADAWIATPAGAFCIFFPTDAHAPLVGEGEIHKVVVKVAVDGEGSKTAAASTR